MSEKWAPGPWGLYCEDGRFTGLIITDESRPSGFSIVAESSNKADATLISAAPDLYAALNKTCSNALELGYCHMADCNACPNMAALRKARGEA